MEKGVVEVEGEKCPLHLLPNGSVIAVSHVELM